jgi:hypothetical protein
MLALLGFVVLVAIFMWTPLTRGGYYSPADVLQRVDILRVDKTHEPANGQLDDPVNEIQPWLEWSRDQLRSGDLPVWNPYNGAGEPVIGNYQSAVFSPFSLPFYILPFRVALLVSAIAKLLTGGIGTFAFLRRVGRTTGAAVVGGVAYAFAGYQVLWLQWPLAATAVLLPVLLLCVEAVVGAESRVAAGKAAIALGLLTAAVIFAGHPETLFFVLAVAGGYAALRLVVTRRARVPVAAAKAGLAAIAALAGLALAAVQLLPFLEYVRRSSALAFRTDKDPVFLSGHLLALHAFPRLLGSPIDDYKPGLVFNLVNGPYIGLVALLLAAIGAISLRKRRSSVTQYFAALAGAWILYAYNVLGLGRALSQLPGFSLAHPNRSAAVWLFSVAVLAAAGVDWLRELPRAKVVTARAAIRTLAPLLIGAAAVAAVAYLLQRDLRSSQHLGAAAAVANRVARHSLIWIGSTFVAGVLVLSVIALARRRLTTRLALAALAALVFAQSGYYLRSYNPTIPDRYFYPHTQLLAALKATTHNEMTLGVGSTEIPPEANLWYRVPSPTNYDAIGVRNYEVVARRALGFPKRVVIAGEQIGGLLGPSYPLHLAALRMMGVRWVTSARDYPWGSLRSTRPLPKTTASWRPLDAAGTRHVTLTLDGLAGNLVTIRTRGKTAGERCGLVIRTSGTANTAIGRTSRPCREGVTTFPVNVDAGAGTHLELAFSGPGEVSIGVDPSGHPIAGVWTTRVTGLESVWERQGVRLFAVPGAVERFFSPARAENVSSARATLSRLMADDFDASQVVLLATGRPARSAGAATAGQVRVLDEAPDHIRLQVRRDQPGWVVAMQSYFPGWHAKVNGARTPIARANYAFQAIRVPAGTSDVELSYRPASVRNGIVISVISALGFLMAIGWVLMKLAKTPRSHKDGGHAAWAR